MTVPVTPAIELSSYQREFVRHLQAAGVRFLILGGMAMRAHRIPRQTEDIDILVEARELVPNGLLLGVESAARDCPDGQDRRSVHLPQQYRFIGRFV